jgi:S-DNA-T family DNA segregation ATPase FtsK/SpoIIIE
MIAKRAWRLDLAAGLLLVAGLAAALAVFGSDPADLPGMTYPPPEAAGNLLGQPGAAVAALLLLALGVAVYPWLAAWLVLVLWLVVRRGWGWSRRLLGWLLLVGVVAVLADQYAASWPGAPVTGAGGAIGAWLNLWLHEQLPPAWHRAATVGAAGAGVLLALGFAVVRAGKVAFRGMARTWKAARRLAPRPRAPVLPRSPSAEFRPRVPQGGIVAEGIPIHHHDTCAPGPGVDLDCHPAEEQLDPTEPRLSNGLRSERERFADFELPPATVLEDARPLVQGEQDQALRQRATQLEKAFADFGVNVRVVGIHTGPVVTLYEVTLETGLRVHKVTCLVDDIALSLRVASVRIVAPIPGKNSVGVEIPNEQRADVRLKEVIQAAGARAGRARVPLFLGKDAEGRPLVADLADMPHLLIAGSTGTGKSVCLNALILSILMTRRPDEVKLVLIDPKNGVEMQCYSKVPHLMSPLVTDMKKAEAVLAWAVDKMEERYDLLRRARVRSIAGYNELRPDEILRRVKPADDEDRARIPEKMPYVVIVIDEMADLVMQMKKEVEGHIIRLAQKSRAAGIHLILATQKPTVDVITGLIKSNLPSRICFKVTNKSDSRVVLDAMGADRLLGKGDLLFLAPGTSDLVRAQGAYASEAEIQRVADYLESDPCYEAELLQLKTKEAREAGATLQERLKARDDLYEAAVDVVVREGRGSVSLLQRALGIGYGRAARLVDFMAEDGIVGGYNGSSARDVLYTREQWAQVKTGDS